MRQIIDEFGDVLLHLVVGGMILGLTSVILSQMATLIGTFLTGLLG